MDFRRHYRYTRSPPPPVASPHRQAPPQQPAPPQAPWLSGQFQYRCPPPPQPQWASRLHSDRLLPLLPPPGPPCSPYPADPRDKQYRPLLSLHLLPPYRPQSRTPQSFPQFNQEWNNLNWRHRQGWEYPVAVRNNEEDWPAKTRAWSATKAVTVNQHPQSQLTPVGRQKERSCYHSHYTQSFNAHYADVLQPSFPALSYQQVPASAACPQRPPTVHVQESASVSTDQSSYIPHGSFPYTTRHSNVVFAHQKSSCFPPSIQKQELSSSYSSVAGKEEMRSQNEKLYKSLPLPITPTQAQQHDQLPRFAFGRSNSKEQSQFAFPLANQSTDSATDPNDQPLHFACRFNQEHDLHVQASYILSGSGKPVAVDSVATGPSVHTGNSRLALRAVYHPIPPVMSSRPQLDPSIDASLPVAGHSAQMFGSMLGTSIRPTIPSAGAAFGIGAGCTVHPIKAFPGDVFGFSIVSGSLDKKEIIEKKAVVASSGADYLEEEIRLVEDEGVNKSLGKGDPAGSKSTDTSRSTDEADDEDNVEATRITAVNQEIKRLLTEVLSKVTDVLFDEISTKVLGKNDLSTEGCQDVFASNHEVSPAIPTTPTPKTSMKFLIPAKAKETDGEDVSVKFTFKSPGDVLGLASYASDDDEGEAQSSDIANSNVNNVHQQPLAKNIAEDKFGNGGSEAENEKHSKVHADMASDPNSRSPNKDTIHRSAVVVGLSTNVEGGGLMHEIASNLDGEGMLDGSYAFESKDGGVAKAFMKTELLAENIKARKLSTHDSGVRDPTSRAEKIDRCETKSSSAGKNFIKEVESGEHRTDGKGDENQIRQAKRHATKERANNYESRPKSSYPDAKEDGKETRRGRQTNDKEDSYRKRKAKDQKGKKMSSHHSESSRIKRHCLLSVGSRGTNSKDNLVDSHATTDSNAEASDDSKRMLDSKRDNLSPSAIKSGGSQVSWFLHSKHSQHRQFSSSSIGTTRELFPSNRRERRSRSSPVHLFTGKDD